MKYWSNFFVANGIEDEGKQRAILLSIVRPQTYSVMQNLLSPTKPNKKTCQQLVTMIKNHFNPQPSEMVQRFKFDLRMKKLTETVTEYEAELHHLAQDCNYGTTLDQMLKDWFVCAIDDNRIQRRLLFLADKVEYLGHKVDAQGLHPTRMKVKAIEEAPEPWNVTELKAYLGLINYYNKFLPNLAMLLASCLCC